MHSLFYYGACFSRSASEKFAKTFTTLILLHIEKIVPPMFPLRGTGGYSLLNENCWFAALREGNHDANTAITKTVAVTSKKSVSCNFTGK